MLKLLDLFSGIGGFSLGLEWAGGFKTSAFCESNERCRDVLSKRWPGIPIFSDIQGLTGDAIHEACGQIDAVCGGFPCQDISLAGRAAGLVGSRSGLWFDMHRIISEVRPRWVIAENVAALRSRGLDRVLGSLAEIGYDAEWHCIPAAAVGAPHRRDRIWIIAYTNDTGCVEQRRTQPVLTQLPAVECRGWWATEPDVGRVAHGIPRRVDRLKQLGNAVVPHIPMMIGRSIMELETNHA
jgi:DNA (cytosine-5)-methyltransferase 1